MSKKKYGKKTAAQKDDGYPFDTGDWAKWSNRKRLDWMVNFRDRLADDKANTYYKRYGMTDQDMQQIIADTAELEKVVLGEEYNAAQTAARNAPSPRESAKLLGELIFDLCDKDYYKARRIGLTDEQIDKMREDLDKYLADVEAWERRQHANDILGIPRATKPPTDHSGNQPRTTFDDIDDTAFKAALAAGDEETARREFEALIAKLESKAAADPVFAKWFEEFKADQEKLLRWDDTIGEDDED